MWCDCIQLVFNWIFRWNHVLYWYRNAKMQSPDFRYVIVCNLKLTWKYTERTMWHNGIEMHRNVPKQNIPTYPTADAQLLYQLKLLLHGCRYHNSYSESLAGSPSRGNSVLLFSRLKLYLSRSQKQHTGSPFHDLKTLNFVIILQDLE